MKTKGARLTTEISLPGRFVVYVPHGEGLGVSRRLEDDERNRLQDIVKEIAPKQGGVIVRTAAEGASAEDVARDLDFLQRLWKAIQTQARVEAPALVYQEAELPLRVVRDLFTGDFEKALVDHDGATSGSSATSRRPRRTWSSASPLPREGRRCSRRSASSGDPLDAVAPRRPALRRLPRLRLRRGVHRHRREHRPVRRLPRRRAQSAARGHDHEEQPRGGQGGRPPARLRDIGGIIVIDFIDMANPKNRASVEEALQQRARARPDEDVRRRDLAARARRDDAPERHRRAARDPDAEVPDVRGRRDRLLGGSAAVDAERRLRALAASKPRTRRSGSSSTRTWPSS